MRPITTLLIFLLPLLSSAQPRSEHFFHERGLRLVYPRMISMHPDGHFVTGNGVAPLVDACEAASLYFWDDRFELSAVVRPPANTYGYRTDLLYITASAWQGDTLFALGEVSCDGGEGPDFSALLAYSKQGELLYTVEWPNCLSDFPTYTFTLKEGRSPLMAFDSSGQLYVALENGLYAFPDPQDYPVEVAEGLQLRQLTGVAALPDQRMALCSLDSLHLLDLATEQLLWSAPLFAEDMVAVDSSLWFISSDSLYRLSAGLSLDAWPLPAPNHSIRMVAMGDGPLLHAPIGSSRLGWRLNPGSGDFEVLFYWPEAVAKVIAIVPAGPDSCYLSGERSRRAFLKKTAFADLQFVPKHDLGVAQLEVVDVLWTEFNAYEGDVYNYRTRFVAETVIENYGTEPVQAFQLDWLRWGPWCVYPGIRVFRDLDLQPGEQLTVRDTLIYSAISPLSFFENDLKLRFATYAPNHYLDANAANDTAFYNLVLTSLHEPPLPEAEVRLFPNPAQGSVQVSSSLPLQGYELYDGLGRLLRRSPLEDELGFELQREGLPAGVYLLRLSAGRGQLVRRVVWGE